MCDFLSEWDKKTSLRRGYSFCIVGKYPPDPDGLSTATYYLAKALMHQGHSVCVIAPTKQFSLKRIYDEGVKIIFVRYGYFLMPLVLFMLGVYSVFLGIDFVNVNCPEGLFFVLGNRFSSKSRLIFSFRDPGVPSYIKNLLGKKFFDFAVRLLAHWAYRIHVPVNPARIYMISRYKADGAKMFIMPSGILISKHENSRYVHGRKPMLLYVGKLEKHKGVHNLLHACTVLKDKGIRDFSLTIVGDGSELSHLRKMMRELNLEDMVVFKGAIPIAEVMKLMYRAYCVFGMGKVIYEAMSVMRPVIGLFDEGFRHQFMAWHAKEIEEDIIICPSSMDPYALSDEIEYLLKDSERALLYGQKAYKFVLQHYDMHKLINIYVSALRM